MALTKVTGHVVKPDTNIQFHNTKSTGIVTFTHSNNATSSTTGALQVTGGVGIVKDLHVGGNVTVGGTLTYEDVTNIDAVGLITARSGINVSGGTLTVANDTDLNGNLDVAGISTLRGNVTIAGITTFSNVVTKFKANNGGNTHLQILSTGSGEAGIFFDAANGDISGSDYAFIGQQNNLDLVIKANSNAGNIDFQRGSDTKLRITTDSKVGIGTTNPVSKLEVQNQANIEVLRLKDTHHNKYLTIQGGGSPNRMVFDSYEGSGGGADIDFASNGSTKVRIKSDGRVGIGSVSPSSDVTLTVNRNVEASSGNATMQINNLYQGTANQSNASGAEIEFKFKNHNAAHNWWGGRILCSNTDNYNQYSNLEFHTASQGNAVERMRLAHDGDLTLFGKDNVELKLKCGSETSDNIIAFINSAGATKGRILYDSDDNFMTFNTNGTASGTERLRITSAGNIEVKGTRNGSLQANDDDALKLFTKSTSDDINRGVGLTFYTHDGSGFEMGGTIQVAKENGTTDDAKSYMRFSTHTGSTTTEKLRITSGGNVLIDTTVTTEASADGNDLIIGSTSDTQKGISIVGSTTNGVGNIFFTDGASYKNQGIIQYRHVDDSMRFTTHQYERVRINKTGCVGIGSTGTDQRLQVSGNIELSAHDNNNGSGGYYTSKGLIIGNAYDAGKTSTDDRTAIIWQERGLDLDIGVNNQFHTKFTYDGKVGIGITNPSSVLHVDKGLSGAPLVTFHQTNGNSSADAGLEVETSSTGTYIQRWINSGDEKMRVTGNGLVGIGTSVPVTQLDVRGSSSASITIGLNDGTKYGNFSCDNSSTYLYGYNGNDIVFSTHTANSFNRKATLTNAGRFAIGSEDTPTTKLYVGISSSTQWSSSKNVSNTTNLDFLALDLINTDNNTNSEVGLMMEAGSSSAAQMTISTKKVSANYAELAIRTRDGGSASKEIWKLRGNGTRYVRTGATIDITGGTESASITPSNGDYIDFARVNYAHSAMGEIFIKWSSIQAPACCHHGAAHIRIGSNHLTYFYGWNDWIDVVSSQAHNSGWFSHWRLRKVVISGTSYLYLQGKWNGSAVNSGSFQVTIGKSAYHPDGGGLVEAVTPVIDNNENGDTSGSNTYGAVQAQVQGKREADSPAVSGDRINKSHSGIFHAYKGLDTQGQISAYNQPRMSANKNAGQTYDSTPTIVTYGNEHFDNGNDYDTSTSTFTCPMDGVYYVSYSANVNASSNWMYLECRVNGSSAFQHSRIMHYNFPRLTFAGTNFVNCSQGDEIAIYGWTNTGTAAGDNFGLFQVYMLS